MQGTLRSLAFAVLLTSVLPTAALAAPGEFHDGFCVLGHVRRRRRISSSGRSALTAEAVAVADGALGLALPAGTTAWWRPASRHSSGTARARLQVANAPSSITGFLQPTPRPTTPPRHHIEIFNDPSGQVMFSTYTGGRQRHTETRSLGSTRRRRPTTTLNRWGSGASTPARRQLAVEPPTDRRAEGADEPVRDAWFPACFDGRPGDRVPPQLRHL